MQKFYNLLKVSVLGFLQSFCLTTYSPYTVCQFLRHILISLISSAVCVNNRSIQFVMITEERIFTVSPTFFTQLLLDTNLG